MEYHRVHMGAQAPAVADRGRVSLLVLRPRQWIHFVVLPLAGGIHGLTLTLALARFVLALSVAALLLGYAYGLNAISDRATDVDARKNPLVGFEICPPLALVTVLTAG